MIERLIPIKAVAPVRIRSGLPPRTTTTRPLTSRNEGQRPCCVSDGVRPGPAVSGYLCPIRARVPVSDGRLTAMRPLRFAACWRPKRATFCALVALVPPRGYGRGSGRRSFLVRRCLGDTCQSSVLDGPVGSGQVRLDDDCGESGLVRFSCGLWNDCETDHLSKQSGLPWRRAMAPAAYARWQGRRS